MHRKLAMNDRASYTGNLVITKSASSQKIRLGKHIRANVNSEIIREVTLSVRSSKVIASKQTHTQAVYTLSWLAVPPFDMSCDVLFMILYSETPLRDDTKKIGNTSRRREYH